MENKHGESHKSTVVSTADPSTFDAAAARIQAGYRGYHFRRTHPELTHSVHTTHHHHHAQHHQHTPSGNPRANEPHELTPSTAATRIQAGFRGYQTRKQIQQHGEPHSEYSSSRGQVESHVLPPELAAAKIQAGFRGYRTRRELKQQHKYPEAVQQINQDNISEIRADPNYAATKIQATFRGYQTRRALHENDSNLPDTKLPLRTHNSNSHSNIQCHARPHQTEHRDPEEVNKAATVIQAGFRGYQTRKHLHSPHSPVLESYHSGGLLNKENADQAATRIQAAYRGFVTRKHLHETVPTSDGKVITGEGTTTSKTRYSDPSEAATKIQATFRGYRTRQQIHVPHRDAHPKSSRNNPSHNKR